MSAKKGHLACEGCGLKTLRDELHVGVRERARIDGGGSAKMVLCPACYSHSDSPITQRMRDSQRARDYSGASRSARTRLYRGLWWVTVYGLVP